MNSISALRLPCRNFVRAAVFGACLLGLATPVLPARTPDASRCHHPKPEFSAVYVFGDSLSDTGRLFAATGSPAAPYYRGRYSNGPVWIEYLAPALGLRYNPATNFSWAGATTGRVNINGPFPGILDELDQYLATLGRRPRADPQALYVVFGGGNDFFTLSDGVDPVVMIDQATRNIVTIVTRLRQLGARDIVVVDLPDMGLTPYAAANRAAATYLSVQFNTLLDARLAAAGLDDLVRVSVFDMLDALVADPAAYGFTNVTDQGIYAADASTYLFWDAGHPTTLTHSILADVVAAAIDDARHAGPRSPHHRAAAMAGR